MAKQVKSILAAIFYFWAYATLAQSNFVDGTVTKKDGETITGQIDYREWVTTPRQIKFRTSAGSEVSIYDFNDLKEFRIIHKDEIYQSAIVDVNNEPIELNDLSQYYSVEKISRVALDRDTVFLLVLAKGRLNLFMLHDEHNKTHYFIQKDGGNIEELIYRRITIRESAPGGSGLTIPKLKEFNDYKNQLNLATKDCPSLQNSIQKVFYSYGILKIVDQYNQCVGQSSYIRPKDRASHSFYAFGGGGSSFVTFKDNYNLKSLSITTPLTYTFGMGFDFGLNRTNNRMSIAIEASYLKTQIDFSSKSNQYDGTYKTLDYKIDLESLRFNSLAKYMIYNGKVQPYIKAGLGIASYFDKAYTRTLSGTPPAVTERDLKKSEIYVIGGLGARLHQFFIEGRFEQGTDINNVDNEDLKMKRLSIVAGFSLRL